jgi:UDP-3-O-[3-hydroxymyristoyl] N-acetylglucosamine deacetylase
MALVGYPVLGHLVVHRGGHALHTALASELLRQRDSWRFVETSASRAVNPVSMPAAVQVPLSH